MINDELFDNAVRSNGDYAGVFEYDGDTGYFYLYETHQKDSHKIVQAIQVLVGTPDFEQTDIAVRWNSSETIVGLFIRGQLWAAFDVRTGEKYGGKYQSGSRPEILAEISNAFK